MAEKDNSNAVKVVLRDRQGAIQEVDTASTAFVEIRTNAGEVLQVLTLRDDGSVSIIDSNSKGSSVYSRWFNVVFAELKKWMRPL